MKLRNSNETLSALIEHVPNIGFYLYIYNQQGHCIADHLQDTLHFAKEQAQEEFGLDYNSWKEE